MEKDWAIEVWGNWDFLGITTELYRTRKEAEVCFKSIRKKLSSSRYIKTRDSIIDMEDNNNAIFLTNLAKL